MPKTLTKAGDILSAHVAEAAGATDATVTTTCPSCGTRQKLSEASVAHEGTDTVYTCVKKCQPILIVSDPQRIELPGRGHRYASLMIRNVAELEVSSGRGTVKVAASPAALEAISGRTLKYRI